MMMNKLYMIPDIQFWLTDIVIPSLFVTQLLFRNYNLMQRSSRIMAWRLDYQRQTAEINNCLLTVCIVAFMWKLLLPVITSKPLTVYRFLSFLIKPSVTWIMLIFETSPTQLNWIPDLVRKYLFGHNSSSYWDSETSTFLAFTYWFWTCLRTCNVDIFVLIVDVCICLH